MWWLLPIISNDHQCDAQPSADQAAIDNRSCCRLSQVMEERKGEVFETCEMLQKSYGLFNSSMINSISVLRASVG